VTPSDHDRDRIEEEEREGDVDEMPRDAVDGDVDPEPQVEPELGDGEPLEDELEEAPHVSVVSEPGRRAGDGDDNEFQYHTEAHHAVEGVPDAIQFIDVHKAFGRNRVLRGLNLGIPEGKISMILGPSGTGKSVCIKHMVGLLYPDQGDIVSRRLQEVGLADSGDKMPNELSGGMRKRAGFARALVLDPEIVLFDEPDSGLDPVRTALLCELIKEVHQENGGSYVVITHDIMSARRVAEFIAVLWRGRIVESGPASDLFNSPNPFVRQFLTGESSGPLGME
jgi:ABC-type transporter Mla maintaining outer membrane lipid asymmetry ATPase subunit MlaF